MFTIRGRFLSLLHSKALQLYTRHFPNTSTSRIYRRLCHTRLFATTEFWCHRLGTLCLLPRMTFRNFNDITVPSIFVRNDIQWLKFRNPLVNNLASGKAISLEKYRAWENIGECWFSFAHLWLYTKVTKVCYSGDYTNMKLWSEFSLAKLWVGPRDG